MRRLLLLVVVALVATLVLSGCGSTKAPAQTRLPDATLQPLRDTGTAVRLRDLRGPTVVSLWANWCTPCRRELPIYEKFHRLHPGVHLLGVNWEDPSRARALAVADQAKVTYPLVVDSQPVIRGQVLPKLILLRPDGTIAFQQYVEIKSLAQLEGLVRKHLEVPL